MGCSSFYTITESFFIWIATLTLLFNINWLIKSVPAGWQRCEINKLHLCDVDKSSELQWSDCSIVADEDVRWQRLEIKQTF